MDKSQGFENPTLAHQVLTQSRISSFFKDTGFRLGFIILCSLLAGIAVIVSTYFIDNIKLLIGLIGGVVFVLLTIRWPEFGILALVTMLSGLISVTWLPILHLGPVSLNISDIVLILLFILVFLRATTQKPFPFYSSPLLLPLLLFIVAILISSANAIIVYHVNANIVLRTVRGLVLWLVFIPTLQLIRSEQSLRRLITGLFIFACILLLGVLFPNKFEPFLPIEERMAATGAEVYSGFTRVYFAGDMILYTMIPVSIASLALIKTGKKFWWIALLGLLLFWLFRTFFRQYWLTLFVICFLLFFIFSSQERFRLLKRLAPALIIGVFILITLVSVLPAQIDRITYVFSDRLGSLLENPFKREGSLQWRVIETRYALDQINRHPILGIGLANRYRPPMEGEGEAMYGWTAKYIENGYLYIAVMMGLIGLIPFLWLCAVYLIQIIRHQHEIRDDGLRAIYIGFGAAFLGMMACNVATPTFVIGSRLIFFPFAMAVTEVILRLEREKNRRIPNLNQAT